MTNTIVMTVSDRPHYLKQTLESWMEVRGLERWAWRFHVEPVGGETEVEVMKEILNFMEWTGHKNMKSIRNPQRLGVCTNPCRAMSKAFAEGARFAYLTEEDVPVSTDIIEALEFLDEELYERQDVMGSVMFSMANGPQEEFYLAKDFSPQGWGVWHDRWPELEATWDHDYSSGVHPNSGWDWNIQYKIRGDRYFAFPKTSRTVHIGEWGAHMRPEQFPLSVTPSYVHERPPVKYRMTGENYENAPVR